MTSESDVELEEHFWADVELSTPKASGSAFNQTLNSPTVNSPETSGSAIALLCWPRLGVAARTCI